VYAFLPGHFRMEGGGQQLARTHCHNSSRPRQLGRVGGLTGVSWFHLREDLHTFSHPLHPRAADEDCMHRIHARFRGAEVQALEVQVGFEGLALAAEGVAADSNVKAAEGLLGSTGEIGCRICDVGREQDHACTGAINGQAFADVLAEGVGKVKGAGQLIDGGGFAAWNDEPVKAVEFLRAAHGYGLGARGFRGTQVLTEVALEGQDTDFQA